MPILPSSEVPQDVGTRRLDSIIEHGLRGEIGGIGFSLLYRFGASFPSPEQFKLTDCLREQEILETWTKLDKGQNVWWEGGDGYGKTTFLGEMRAFIEHQSLKDQIEYRIIEASFSHSSIQDTERELDTLAYYKGAGQNLASRTIFILDSADYLWEDTSDTQLKIIRLKFIQQLLSSDCKVIMTAHDVEPQHKKVDIDAKKRYKNLLKIFNVDINKLSPYYSIDKTISLLERLGFPSQIAANLVDIGYFPAARRHSVLSNYIIGGQDKDSLTSLLSWLSTALHSNSSESEIINFLKRVFVDRDRRRLVDWATIGF